jgi:hypothetical protein
MEPKATQKAIGIQLTQAPSPCSCIEDPPFPANEENEPFGSLIAGDITNSTMMAIPDAADLEKYDSLRARTPPLRNQSSYKRVAAAYWKKYHSSPPHWPHAKSGTTAIGGPQEPLDRVGELPINQQHATSAWSPNPHDLASSHGQGELQVVIDLRDLPKRKQSRKLVKCDPYQGCTRYGECQRAFDSHRSGMT